MSLRTRRPSRRRPAFSSQRPRLSPPRPKTSAIADYITRLIKAYAYLKIHPQVTIHTVYEGQYGVTPARAAAISAAVGPTSFFELPGAMLAPQQNLANLYLAAGSIPSKIVVSKEFNPRFNSLVSSAEGS